MTLSPNIQVYCGDSEGSVPDHSNKVGIAVNQARYNLFAGGERRLQFVENATTSVKFDSETQ